MYFWLSDTSHYYKTANLWRLLLYYDCVAVRKRRAPPEQAIQMVIRPNGHFESTGHFKPNGHYKPNGHFGPNGYFGLNGRGLFSFFWEPFYFLGAAFFFFRGAFSCTDMHNPISNHWAVKYKNPKSCYLTPLFPDAVNEAFRVTRRLNIEMLPR